MLTMEKTEKVRRAVLVEGKSQRMTAREFGHGRNTVAKYLEGGEAPVYRRQRPPGRPVIESFAAILDAWVEGDKKAPRKQRRTGTRMFERLTEEYGYTGSVSAVRRYLQTRQRKAQEVFFPLVFQPGEEGQVDWGEAVFLLNGRETTAHLFGVRLAHSRADFVRAYPAERLEMFLDGHVRAFEFFGGVPRRLAYDNLKSAVIQVGRGQERTLNRRFLELRSHYLFESRFCNVASGWETGAGKGVSGSDRDLA